MASGPGTERHRWLVLAGLAFGACIGSGFARFGYGLILPSMQADLGWDFTRAGWIGTVNAIGYLVGAVACLWLFSRFAQERLFAWGAVLTVLFLGLSALTRDFWLFSAWRFAAGVTGAPIFIATGALASNLFGADQRRNAMAIALAFGGGGLGMVLCAIGLPALFAAHGPTAWPWGWAGMAAVGAAMLPLSLWAALQLQTPRRDPEGGAPPPLRSMMGEMAGYFCFAVGYIVYLTFLSAWMRSLGAAPVMVGAVWTIVGLGTILSSFVWRGFIGRFRSGLPLAVTLAALAGATVLPVLVPTLPGLLISSVLFGLTVFMPPTSITSYIRQNTPPDNWGRLMSIYTVIFAVGQCIGPVAAGWIGDLFFDIGYGLAAAAAILFLGAGFGLVQRGLGDAPAAR